MNASVRHACKTVEPQQNSSPRRGKCILRGGAVQHLQQDSKPKGCDDAVFGLVFGVKFKLWHRHVQVSFLEKREGHALALSFPRASPSSLARGSADILGTQICFQMVCFKYIFLEPKSASGPPCFDLSHQIGPFG